MVFNLGSAEPQWSANDFEGSQRLKVRTFFLHYTALHLISGEKLDVSLHLILAGKSDMCGRVDLFFGFHLILAGKLDVCGRVDFYLVFA